MLRRKRLLSLLLSLVIVCVLGAPVPVTAAGVTVGADEAKVGFLTGHAEIREKGQRDWRPLTTGMTVAEGDWVRTGADVRIELVLPDKSRMRFAGESEFNVVRIAAGGMNVPRDIKIHLTLGKAWSRITQILGVKGNVELASDRAVVGVRGTAYGMNVDPDRSVLVRVYDGTVQVSGKAPGRPGAVAPPDKVPGPRPVPGPHRVSMAEWTLIVSAMQQVRIGADGSPGKPAAFDEAEGRDEWVDWNRMRDREIGYR